MSVWQTLKTLLASQSTQEASALAQLSVSSISYLQHKTSKELVSKWIR
jgi:hypothetical protein